MATLDELSINISADTADFRAGAEGVESSLDDISSEALQTAASLQILQGRTDEAGDEMTQLSAKSGVASAGLSTLSNAAFGTQVAFLGLSVATTASLIPALVALSTALLPIVSAFGGILAIGLSTGLIGIAGAIGAVATDTEFLKQQALGVAETLRTEFAPAIDLATAVIDILLGEFEDIIPALVPATGTLQELAGNFANFGEAIINALPPFVELAVTLANEFLPVLTDLAQDVLPEVPGLIESFVEDLERLAPSLLTASTLLFDLLGAATEFGFTVLSVLGPALSTLTRGLTNVFRMVNNAADGVGKLIAAGSLAAPIVIGLASLLGGPLTAGLAAVVGTVAAVGAAFRTNFANIRDVVTGVSAQLQEVLPAAKNAFNAFVSGVNIQSITDSFSAFESVLGNQLIATLEALKPVYSDLITFFNENQEQFRTIGEAFGTLVNVGIELATVFVNLIFPAIRNFVIPAIRAGIDALDFMIDKLATAIELTQAIAANDFEEATDIALEAVGTSEQQFAQQIQADQQQQQEFNERIEVIVEGDTDVVRDVSTQVVNEESRAARRNTGTPSGVR